MMSENIYAEPGIIKKVRFDCDDKESVVDIYVSSESLRVYDNPWVEGTSPNIQGPAGPQHPGSAVSENSVRRNCSRADSLFQRVLYLLLLAGIVALICLGVQMKKDKSNWRSERSQLLDNNTKLRKISEQLTANNTELTKEIDRLWKRPCGQKPKKKCKTEDRS